MRLLQKILVPPILITVVFVGILAYLYRTGEANIEAMQRELDEFSATAKQVNQDGIENLVHVIESVIEDPLLELNARTINSIVIAHPARQPEGPRSWPALTPILVAAEGGL